MVGGGQHALGDADDEVVGLVTLALRLRLEQLDRREKEEQPKEVEEGREAVDERDADEACAKAGIDAIRDKLDF